MYSRNAMVTLAKSWIGKNQADGSHKEIVDIYNSHSPLPRNIRMTYDWAWCACTWSALAIKLGYTSIIPIEISCGQLIEEAKKMGCWIEDDRYVACPGDAILYDWDDNGIGDNRGWPDHVGIIEYSDPVSGYYTVIEGNYGKAVKVRTISINGRYIRGFIVPNYDVEETIPPSSTGNGKTVDHIAHEVITGKWGTGEARKKNLSAAGFNYAEVQARVNEILNGSAVKVETAGPNADVKKEVKCTCTAKRKNNSIGGAWRTTANLYLRNDAGTNKKALVLIPKGTTVQCYGYYNVYNGARWFLVEVVLDGVKYTGFSHSGYLTR